MSHAPITCELEIWCPRKDSNLQPLVCRTSAPSVELLGQKMVVGVGIEPTFRAFQTRANPSQLSDRRRARNFSRPPPSLVVHFVHDVPIVVHVPKQQLS